MSQVAINLVLARLPVEEGRKPFAYNDATGKRVTCKPGGNLSIGEGINLEEGLAPEEITWLTTNRITILDAKMQPYQWYQNANDARKSVFLDVAFNQGFADLLHYPHMLACATSNDWEGSADNLTDKDPSIDKSRYAPLRAILSSGVIA